MVYVLLADGFEEVEAFAPVDFLRRAGVEVTTVSLSGDSVVGAHGLTVLADRALDQVTFDDASMIVLPGGMPGATHLDEHPAMDEILSSVFRRGGVLAAICAAPLVLGKRGYLEGKKAVCYPGFESFLSGAEISADPVVRDGQIITAKGAGVAWQFGAALAQVFVPKSRCDEICKGMFLIPYGD